MGVSPLQLANLHRNQRYFVIELHTWFCLSYFLKTNLKFYCIYQYFMSINSFFNTACFSIQPPNYSDPWPRLARSSSFFFLIMLFNYTHFANTGKQIDCTCSEVWQHRTSFYHLIIIWFRRSIKSINLWSCLLYLGLLSDFPYRTQGLKNLGPPH